MTHPNDESAAARRARFDRATSHLEPPFALVDLESFRTNETDLVRRAGGKPIRLASKSVRCRTLQSRALENPGFKGTLAFTLPEALWLADNGFDDLVVAYPTVDRSALATLAERHADRITLMVDSSAHLDLIADAATDPARPIRVAIDVDAGLRLAGGRIRIGAKRSPVHTPEEAADLALDIVRRAGIELVGLMAYEAQVAGVGDRPKSRLEGAAIRALQSCSMRELKTRRAAIVAAVRNVAPLEFVNGGGSGSVERTAAEEAVTEVAAGSALFGPTLFDTYRSFRPAPAAYFALPVVRKPSARVATVLGGGYLASGPGDRKRLPTPVLPEGLRFDKQEGAGEVQTPLLGEGAADLNVGDRVYFRHAKAGEMCERFDVLHVIEGDRVVEEVPTYRGEGRCFL